MDPASLDTRRFLPDGHRTFPAGPSSSSTRTASRGPGTTSRRICRCRRRRRSTRAPASPSVPPTWLRCSRWRSSSRRSARSGRSRSRSPCARRTRCTGPSPLYRAHRLEKALGTPAHIYYKYEGVSPAGSHKPNTAIPQAYYNKQEGVKRIATETGAGQWGTALAFAGAIFGLEVKVYMVRASYDQKPYRRMLMETYGAEVVASPQPDDELRPRGARGDARHARARWASPSARRSRTPRPATTRSTPSARCSTTCCCTRR